MRYTIISLLAVMFVLVPVASFAGDIDSPGPPSAGSGMYTIGDIYNYLIDGTEPGISGVFREPAAGPGATMKSTKDIYDNTKAKFDSCDATPDKVLDGVTFFRTDPANWGPRAGTMTNNGAGGTITPGTTDQAIAAGYWSSANTVKGDADLTATKIKKDVDIFGVVGSVIASTGTAGAGDVLTGKTFSNNTASGVAGSMPNKGAVTYTPTTAEQTVAAGYHNGSGKVEGDANLVTGNIKSGVTIFGVAGKTEVVDTTEASSPVVATRMKTGDVGFVNGNKITGTGTKTLSPANDTVAEGYYAATTLSTVDADLTGANIKKDVDIFGKVGTYPLAGVEKTGQTPTVPFVAPTGSDGDLQKGVAWPNPRFTDNSDGTVTDNLTGLIWLKNANCDGTKTWAAALTYCNNLAHGTCDLTDGSEAGDWRLPNVKELLSLIDRAFAGPALSNDAGTDKWGTGLSSFSGVQSDYYWSSTTCAHGTGNAWSVGLGRGYVGYPNKTNSYYVWPVRGGQ